MYQSSMNSGLMREPQTGPWVAWTVLPWDWEGPIYSGLQEFDPSGRRSIHVYDLCRHAPLPFLCLKEEVAIEIIMTADKINFLLKLESLSLKRSEILGNSQEQAARGSYEAVLHEILNVLKANLLCASTVDSACYVHDRRVLDFHRACYEHHLLRGQGGIVGKAFETNQPCFATDATEYNKVDYPLSHHAKMFGLHAAVAIQLCSIYNASIDYFITVKGLEQQTLCPGKLSAGNEGKLEFSNSQKNQQAENLWFSNIMNPKRKGKEPEWGAYRRVQANNSMEQEPAIITTWTVEETCGSTSAGQLRLGAGGKRRTKAQNPIGLQVLRHCFAGSLKDAARSIGGNTESVDGLLEGLRGWVTPSGNFSWCSRRLKLSSFYSNFLALNLNDQPKQQLTTQTEGNIFSSGANFPSTSSSHPSTSSRRVSDEDASPAGDLGGPLKRAHAEAGLRASNKCSADRSSVETRPHLTIRKNWPVGEGGAFKAKAAFGEEKVRLTILPNMGFQALRQELAMGFEVEDVSKIGIMYLDDDKECVLLTCDADLKECIDIHKSSRSHTIKLAPCTTPSLGGSVRSGTLS
ncbi:hypothetical protein Cgig2_032418 [Carnegiea gigantea]|uniref:PB1 domain-containing protein n=1 Tax=Carnegiea gigantea TaxID=171969 RepID=A0A9Q1QPU5_9CARY|nr:hypothetical protein Cgig2_032418 [Carnegiea gigantea]